LCYKSQTTVDIAELTGKEHRNVLADVDKMLDDLEIGRSYLAGNGKHERCYHLPERELYILASGFGSLQIGGDFIEHAVEL
jgi:phage regulator Rha-like protein